MQPALEAFGLDALRDMLRGMGIGLTSPDGFHLYPEPASARGVRDALRAQLTKAGVVVRTGTHGAALIVNDGRCRGVRLQTGAEVEADAVVLATGGAAMPSMGADGSGYAFARTAGHTVRGPYPALVPLVAAEDWAHGLAGVSLAMVELRVESPAQKRERWRGPLLFTHRGISGPAALNASGAVAEALAQGAAPLTVRIDLAPSRSAVDWAAEFVSWRERHGARMLPALLAATVPASVAAVLATLAGVEGTPCARWTRDQHAALAQLLSGLPLTVASTEGFAAAMVTRGGVVLREVAPKALESRLLPGFFLAGEVLDLDGPCGGYNLLWAFSGGHLAGTSAACPRR
jgi:hypothetical protein